MSACLICQQEQVDPSLTVFADELWAAGVIAGFDVPGWIVLRLRRHAEGLPSLTPHELETFGPRARDVVAAVAATTGAVATYLMVFGEANPHFHALITPRTVDVPEARRRGDILQLRFERGDLEAARAAAAPIRLAYERLRRA